MPGTIQVTVTAGQQMEVTIVGGDTQTYPAVGFSGAAVLRKPRFVYGVDNNDTTWLPSTPPIDYYVRCHFQDQRFFDIPMGYVSNQGSWVNTQVGANACVTSLKALFT